MRVFFHSRFLADTRLFSDIYLQSKEHVRNVLTKPTMKKVNLFKTTDKTCTPQQNMFFE